MPGALVAGSQRGQSCSTGTLRTRVKKARRIVIGSGSFDIIAHVDGGSRGNPGPAGYGVVLTTADGMPVAEIGEFIGRTTNNFAEYQGLLAALDYAIENGHRRVKIRSDSELMVRQLQGRYKVNSPALAPLYQKARQMIAGFDAFAIEHIPRELNRQADRLANLAMDRGKGSRVLTPIERALHEKTAERIKVPNLHARATYHQGVLKLQEELPLSEGEEVEIKIIREEESGPADAE